MTLEPWQLISLFFTLLGMFLGLAKLLLSQFERRVDGRFDTLMVESRNWRNVENDVLKLRLEIAERYVKRDDYVRGQTVIEAKLDAISSELKNVQIQGARRES